MPAVAAAEWSRHDRRRVAELLTTVQVAADEVQRYFTQVLTPQHGASTRLAVEVLSPTCVTDAATLRRAVNAFIDRLVLMHEAYNHEDDVEDVHAAQYVVWRADVDDLCADAEECAARVRASAVDEAVTLVRSLAARYDTTHAAILGDMQAVCAALGADNTSHDDGGGSDDDASYDSDYDDSEEYIPDTGFIEDDDDDDDDDGGDSDSDEEEDEEEDVDNESASSKRRRTET